MSKHRREEKEGKEEGPPHQMAMWPGQVEQAQLQDLQAFWRRALELSDLGSGLFTICVSRQSEDEAWMAQMP